MYTAQARAQDDEDPLITIPRGRTEILSFPSISETPVSSSLRRRHRSSHEIAYGEKGLAYIELTRSLCKKKKR